MTQHPLGLRPDQERLDPAGSPRQLSISVVIITYARPTYLRDCLQHLGKLDTEPHEIIVVDGSPDDRTREIVRTEFPGVVLISHRLGRGTMPESRDLGLRAATGDVVAFIDDDANVDPAWLDELAAPYADPTVTGVGGRAANGIPDEETTGLGSIGRFLPDGRLTGNFGADPGRVIEVHHMLGANMSYRRQVLLDLGGIRGSYPGTCLCEESDIALRVRADGGRLVFTPRALVRHVAAPYSTGGQRFDRRYLYYSRRNHVVLLARNFGFGAPVLRRFTWTVLREQQGYWWIARSRLRHGRNSHDGRTGLAVRLSAPVVLTRAAFELAGLVAGFPAAAVARRRDRRAGVATP